MSKGPTSKGSLESSIAEIDLRSELSPKTWHALVAIAQVADELGTATFLVGGLIRDIVLGNSSAAKPPDICVIGGASGFADAVISTIQGAEVLSRSQFETLQLRISEVTLDVASTRADFYASPGALPRIQLVDSIKEDLARRDFTMNAMAVPINKSGLGRLVDPFGGYSDAKSGTLRVLHPRSFADDPTRMLRGIRLAARCGFNFDASTEGLFESSLHGLRDLCSASPVRVFNELRQWFQPHENLEGILELAGSRKILRAVGLATGLPYATRSKLRMGASTLERFATFTYGLSTNDRASLAGLSTNARDWNATVSDCDTLKGIVSKSSFLNLTNSELHDQLRGIRTESINAAINLEAEPEISSRLRLYRETLRVMAPSIDGSEVIDLGVAPGPEVGEVLADLLRLRLDGEITSKEQEVDYVSGLVRQRNDDESKDGD